MSPENWFVVQLKPNGHARAEVNLARQGFATFTPRAPGRPPRPLFPGYLFAQFDPDELRWAKIRSTLGVARLLTNDRNRPQALPGQWMAGLIAGCGEDDVLLPPEDLAAGDRVRIVSGPFAEELVRIREIDAQGRIKFLFEILGRAAEMIVARENVMRA